MTVNPTTSTTGTSSSDSTDTSSIPMQTLGQDDFLKLLAVQMQAQDPLDPMKDTEFISQMSSFTSLQQMKDLTTTFQTFSTAQQATAVQTYLGKTVTVQDSTSSTGLVTGPVTGVDFSSGSPQIVINGTSYDTTAVQSVTNATSTTSN